MEDLREEVLAAARAAGLPEVVRRREELRVRLTKVCRELAEVRGRIPLRDRLLFFLDTEDEAREAALEREQATTERELAGTEERLRELERPLADRYPPVGLVAAAERCLALGRTPLADAADARTALAGRDALLPELDALADRLLELYAPGLEPERLLAQLEAPAAPGPAGPPAALEPHPALGLAPLAPDRLLPLVAARLAAGDYPARVAEQARLERERAAREEAHRAAIEAVPLADRLEVFSASRAERARDAAAAAAAAAREEELSGREQVQRALCAALAAYPPLDAYLRVIEAEAVATVLERADEEVLDRRGRPVRRRVARPRALLLLALGRAVAALRRAFPWVPTSAELAGVGTPEATPAHGPLFGAFVAALEASEPVAALRERALESALMLGHLRRALERERARSSWVSRLLLRSGDEARLEARAAWHRQRAGAAWRELLEEARRIAATAAPPLALQELALDLLERIALVRTDALSSTTGPVSCTVYGREEAALALDRIRTLLGDAWGVTREGRDSLLDRVLAAASRPLAPSPAEPHRVHPRLAAEDVAAAVAHALRDAPLEQLTSSVREGRPVVRQLELLVGRSGPIPLADRLNVLTDSPDEARARELERRRGELRAAEDALRELVDPALAGIHPPSALQLQLADVESALLRVSAECRSSTQYDDRERAERLYRCVLVGQEEARDRALGWARALVRAFGELPTCEEALDTWALDGAGPPPAREEGRVVVAPSAAAAADLSGA